MVLRPYLLQASSHYMPTSISFSSKLIIKFLYNSFQLLFQAIITLAEKVLRQLYNASLSNLVCRSKYVDAFVNTVVMELYVP